MNYCHLQLIVKISSPFKLFDWLREVHERHCGSISKSHILGVLYYTCEGHRTEEMVGRVVFQ